MEAVLVYVTAAGEEEARRIGRLLVERRLAACVNVIPKIFSAYQWKGELVEDQEAVLLVKTTRATVDRVIRAVKEVHSYEVPAILVLEVAAGYEPFLDWVAAEVEGCE